MNALDIIALTPISWIGWDPDSFDGERLYQISREMYGKIVADCALIANGSDYDEVMGYDPR